MFESRRPDQFFRFVRLLAATLLIGDVRHSVQHPPSTTMGPRGRARATSCTCLCEDGAKFAHRLGRLDCPALWYGLHEMRVPRSYHGCKMDFLIIGIVAFIASGLTLYSGFGLGTILLPAFAFFFPVPIAVAATGAVHLLNNLFKSGLLGRKAHWPTVLRFGLPAIPFAILGAWALSVLGNTAIAFEWSVFGRVFTPSAASVVIGLVMIAFAILELQPWFQRLAAPPRLMPLGGVITGFIGGLTGQQGAFRSMFLLKSGLEPARFIPTGVLIAILIDLSRLPTYALAFSGADLRLGQREGALIAVGTLCAFAGAYLGARFLEKATIEIVRIIVAGLMLVIGSALVLGIIGT